MCLELHMDGLSFTLCPKRSALLLCPMSNYLKIDQIYRECINLVKLEMVSLRAKPKSTPFFDGGGICYGIKRGCLLCIQYVSTQNTSYQMCIITNQSCIS